MIRLSMIRENAGLSQKELGEVLGVAQNTVSNWEKGIREPNHEMLSKIAKYFEIPVMHLLGQGIYEKKELVREHIDIILDQIEKNDGGHKIVNMIREQDFETQFKVLTAFIMDIDIDEENRTMRIIYYI